MLKLNARSPSLTSQESYSAVIIADLVAEVPVEPSENEQKYLKATKEETNLGFDGHMDKESCPAVVNVDLMETTNISSMKTNGTNFSKGLILNPMQFKQNESKIKGDDKLVQMSNAQILTQPIQEPSGFKDMSLPRKLAFGFSFLPSILFVLCFSIILPCKVLKPCVEEMWIQNLNNTEPTSNLQLQIQKSIAFTTLENGVSYFVRLDTSSGNVLSKENLSSTATYINCGKVIDAKQEYCIVMDDSGKIYAYNSSGGGVFWNPVEDVRPSLPVTLPDCNNDGVEEIAVAVSNKIVKVLSGGNIITKFDIYGCDTVPTNLMPWKGNGSTDLIFTCQKAGKDILVKIPQNAWCYFDKSSPGNILMMNFQVQKGYILHPVEEGLLLWSGDDISMMLSDGNMRWKISNDSHSDKNRVLLYGNFLGENKQIVLLSSDISSKLEISILNSSDGSILRSKSVPHSEAMEMIHIKGKERDFVLVLLNKISTNVLSEALANIDGISTTIINYISNEDVGGAPIKFMNDTTQELAFLDLDGSLHSIKNLKFSSKEGTNYKIAMAAYQTEKLLTIYVLASTDSISSKGTEIRKIEVANWDISESKKSSHCALK